MREEFLTTLFASLRASNHKLFYSLVVCGLMLLFSLAGCEVPTKATLSLPLLIWTREKKKTMKGSWVG